jgi:hypothetical protein
MKVKGAEAYSISKVINNNVIFSKSGNIAYLYELRQPEKYSLNEEKFDNRINEFFTAFRTMPNDTYVHKQDIYQVKAFDESIISGSMFLDEAMRQHFAGREGIQHQCILGFVITKLKSLDKSYLKNPFKYKEGLEEEDRSRLLQFEENVRKAINIINNTFRTKVVPLTQDSSRYYIYQYVNCFETAGFYDIDFRDKSIGENKFDLFSFPRIEYFPDHMTNIKKDDISKEEFTFWEGAMDMVGETLECPHIYNQIFYFQGNKRIESEIDLRMNEYGKLRSMSERIDKKFLQLEQFLKNVSMPGSDTILIKAHYNLILFEKNKEILNRAKSQVEGLLQRNDINFYKPEKEVLKDVFLGSIIGRESHLHKDNFFITHIKQALCLFTNTTMPRSEEKGVWFNNRVNQLPLRKDIWDEDKNRIYARNAIIVANTGGGKSVTALNIIMQFLSQGVNAVVAEFGRSFQFITYLYPELSAHIEYTAEKPLGINPFKIPVDTELSTDKLSLLNSIILKTWRVKENFDNTHVIVSINKLLQSYYKLRDVGHSYEDFYHFVVNGGKELLKKLDIQESYFDVVSFKHICSEFISGGKYEMVFREDETVSGTLREKQFVVFELTEIKQDPFLVTLILLILQETINSNILSDRGKKGVLIFDEFAETQAIKDMYSGEEVIQTVAILYQKIRKENGAVYIIIQDPSQLPDNNYTAGIIANTQVLMVLPSNKVTYLGIQEKFKLEEHEMYQILSLKNNKVSERPYSELFLKLGEESTVVRLELSPEALLAFQTDGEKWKEVNTEFQKTKDMKKAINNLLS